MLHFIACTAIAYFLAYHLNARITGWFTALWSGAVATVIGLALGTLLVIGGLQLFGVPVNQGGFPKALAQAFLWTVLAAAAGIYQGRQKANTGNSAPATSTPAKGLLGWGALTVAVLIGAVSVFGSLLGGQSQPVAAQQATTASAMDKDGKPCTEITEFLGECKRQP